jgi:hypothetical protein
MANGLGMSPPEWQELRNQVDDSFWVMRVIGMFVQMSSGQVVLKRDAGYPPLPTDHDGFSCGAHK